MTEGGEKRFKLDYIVGEKDGLGVENMRGSGLNAGETAAAYAETFTLSYVTGRSVGIGAYINRLAQRVVQMSNGPIILTGFSALNKLLGKEVYVSQDRLGGPQIMLPNGVAHQLASDDQDGVEKILKWLSYVPYSASSLPSFAPSADPVDRPIGFLPSTTPYDPRHMLAGTTAADGSWQSGFFDQGSFTEYLADWGKSVVMGRAKLGGVPMGVVAVETRLTETRIPADPANPASRETVLQQAGQVWFPDSAFKTAAAIQDLDGENMPLMIFANWRGFSGGTRDMYGEILKFGSFIVANLRTYSSPVFVYIPPNGELRGGAWVVVDPTINEAMMEMYAEETARGGILEPPGICDVKFRKPDLLKTMHRQDAKLQQLSSELSVAEEPRRGRGRRAAQADRRARDRAAAALRAGLVRVCRPARPAGPHGGQGRHPRLRAVGEGARLLLLARAPPPRAGRARQAAQGVGRVAHARGGRRDAQGLVRRRLGGRPGGAQLLRERRRQDRGGHQRVQDRGRRQDRR